ncbi:MAG: ATP-dependent DNA ligase, partial [Betaproteobacteria bacterium]
PERYLLTKLVGGGFRVGVSKLLVQRAIAERAGLQASEVAQRMMGYTQASVQPTAQDWLRLIGQAQGDRALQQGQPYPFFLAQSLNPADEGQLESVMGPVDDWLVEWKYDGIRAQVVRRAQQVWIWSRGEELITDRFPEVAQAAQALPDGTVLDGELLVMRQGHPASFAELQTRITRKTLSKAILAKTPVSFIAYDLLEHQGQDWRPQAQQRRRQALQVLLSEGPFSVSPLAEPDASTPSWAALQALRQQSRARGVEGFMLKHRAAPYGLGRRKLEGPGVLGWWKWKVQPMTCDAVLIYAQKGHGRRASLFTDYTFAVWNEGALVPFARAYSGLSDAEIREVDRFIREHTQETFGPVRSVTPELVFELAFEGIQPSPRHKSGIAVRFPRMLRWRRDKRADQADSLQTLRQLLAGVGQ